MKELKVGEQYAPILGRPEGVIFDADASGYTLIYNFSRPTQKEIDAVKSSQPFTIRFTVIDGIIWILTKCGSLNWTDAPYTPFLSAEWEKLEYPPDGMGTLLTLMMTDATDGTIKHLRAIGLGTSFSRDLREAIFEVGKGSFDISAYDQTLRRTYAAYTTKDLVGLSSKYYKVK